MEDRICFGSWRFASDLRSANHVTASGEIRFTRAEQALLAAFVRGGSRVLGREQLLDAVSGIDSDVSDRRVDFTINRLRRKLKDSARQPTYIATEYGEGYRWIAERVVTQRSSSGAFIVVGPVRGLHLAGQLAQPGWAFIEELAQEISQRTERHHAIKLDVDCPPADTFVDDPPRFAVVLNFVSTPGEALDCAITVKQFRAGTILKVTRIRVCSSDPRAPSGQPLAKRVAADIVDETWRELNRVDDGAATPDEELLSVRLHRTALLFSNEQKRYEQIERRLEALKHKHPVNYGAVSELLDERLSINVRATEDNERRLRERLRERPDDHESAILLATTLHIRYLVGGYVMLAQADRRPRDETEIESLVTASLPHIQDNGILVLSAAHLLYFINRGHQQLALNLAETAFETTTAFAVAFATLGQLRMWEGRIDEAVALYDEGLSLAPPDTHFYRRLLIFKCQALAATGDRGAEGATATELIKSAPTAGTYIGLFFAASDENNLRLHLQSTLTRMDQRRARAEALFAHYTCARLFRLKLHRQNLLHRPLSLLVDRFGPRCIPDEVRADAPPDVLTNTRATC